MIPIIVLIPGFAVNLKGRKATPERASNSQDAPGETSHASDGDKILPHTAPYTRNQANEIYCAAVDVAQAMTNARGLEADEEDPLWLVEAINGRALHFGRKHGHDHRLILGAMATIGSSIRKTALRGKDHVYDRWRRADAENFERLLALMFVMAEAHVEASAERRRPIASKTDGEAAAVFRERFEKELRGEGPVNILEDKVVVEASPKGAAWIVDLKDIPNQLALLKWVSDLSSKTWATGDTIRSFVGKVCTHKGWEIYNFDTTPNQELA